MNAQKKPVLCYVTDRKQLPPGRTLDEAIHAACECGASWVQIREKDLRARELVGVVQRAVGLPARSETRIIVNDRLDVALAAGAHGVHLGGQSLPVEAVTPWVRREVADRPFLVGVSCHSVEDVLSAERSGASYAFLGPIFATPSKARFGPPLGIEPLRAACGAAHIPVLAIGGVSETNARECIAAGASGIAAIRLFQGLDAASRLNALIASLA